MKLDIKNLDGVVIKTVESGSLILSDLSGADLRRANLSGADLSEAYLGWADLRGADLRGAKLSGASLSGANLRGADLREADLRGANLSGADLSGADLGWADLSGADMSVAKGLNFAQEYIGNFDTDDKGVIVFKGLGMTNYNAPAHWKIEPGSFITEVCNPLPTVACGCGVNFASLEWIKKNYPNTTIWKCRINWIDLVGVVVPYNTDGKARCNRLELLEIVT